MLPIRNSYYAKSYRFVWVLLFLYISIEKLVCLRIITVKLYNSTRAIFGLYVSLWYAQNANYKRLFKNIVTFVESILYLYNDGGKNEKKKRVARIYKNGQNVLMLKDYVYLFGTSTDLKLSSYQRAEQHLKLK